MKIKILCTLLATSSLLTNALLATASAAITPEVRQENFNLAKKNLALNGYDPVSYFESGPVKGSKKITGSHQGITYRFANEANREAFKTKPSQYEPQYGGWCAWAMHDGGGRTEPDPLTYKIVDGQLYVFYKGFFGNTRELWNEAAQKSSESTLIKAADTHWLGQVGK